MPTMTGIVHHNDPIHQSPYSLSTISNNAYYSTSNNPSTSSSKSPSALGRKRKQELQYSQNNSSSRSNILDLSYPQYSQWDAESTNEPSRPIYANADSLGYQPEDTYMQLPETGDSSWNNSHLNNNSTGNTMHQFLPNNMVTSQVHDPQTSYDLSLLNSSTPINQIKPCFGQFMSDISQQTSSNNDDGVGENRELNEINQMLYPFEQSPPHSQNNHSTYEPYDPGEMNEQKNELDARNMESLHQRQQQQMIQSWSSTALSSPIQSPSTSQQGFSPNTPAFFNSGFLESLQEGDETYSSDQFTFVHRPNSNTESTNCILGWNSSNFVSDAPVEPTSVMPSSRSMVSPSTASASQGVKEEKIHSTMYPQSTVLNSSPSLSSSPIANDRESYSSASSSPPITPIYGQLTNLSIQSSYQRPSSALSTTHSSFNHSPETLEDHSLLLNHESRIPISSLDHRRILQAGVANSRLLHNVANEAKLKPLIRKYLNCTDSNAIGERTVVILTSKVAQKSYGTEKRFLCPPPTAILIGTSWWTSKKKMAMDNIDTNEILRIPGTNFDDELVLAPPKVTVSISGEASSQPGQIEWYTVSGATVGQTGHIKSQQPQQAHQQEGHQHPSRFRSSESRNSNVDWYHNQQQEHLAAGKCVSKHLYINDADEKRKRVECLIRVQLANGLPLGILASKGIKVISKPSKKRQSVKNMELCIHHGTTVSLFNRIRSQTVSTKYLGVSTRGGTPFSFPGQPQNVKNNKEGVSEGTCFVARTTCWDPFVIWVVDTTRSPSDGKESDTPEDYIGRHATTRNIPYPPPPAIALKNETNQLIPIHYNQHVVLQCLTTGLVSPVMIIRKVDKASTVVGGARSSSDDINAVGGGEFGDEILGDPVSQLHKVALQIVQDPSFNQSKQQEVPNFFNNTKKNSIHYTNMMPRTSQPVTYLACLNDMVGMHKTTEARKPMQSMTSAMSISKTLYNSGWEESMSTDQYDVTSQEGGKIVRKRRVSTDVSMLKPPGKLVTSMSLNDLSDTHATLSSSEMTMIRNQENHRRRVNSLNDDYTRGYYPMPPHSFMAQQRPDTSRKSSVSSNGSAASGRRSSVASAANLLNTLGAYWSEDVSDAAVWTIVGTDCATYTFLSPNMDEQTTPTATTVPFPSLIHFKVTTNDAQESEQIITMHGENFSRDLQIWFGDVKISHTEYRSRELIICRITDRQEFSSYADEIPILLVRGDGTVCKTNHFYQLKN
ncbi:hypothetical protein BDB01DRAFT_795730 [Pilobolus umbonatus]|nr:hypothetical protein BDB01DRAFT_795730 [Pilobolus umbonatus]